MRQRTKLAQALVADPELVLLDEPTAGLDPIGREEMLALVGRLSTFGISVVLATHLLDDVQAVCDHVVMIDAGRLVLAGPTTQLLERAGTVRVDVGRSSDGLVDELARRGLAATILDDASLEISGNGHSGDEVLDTVRDAVAQLGLPLHALSTRHASLDEVFLRTAGER
jgi:ABC-2 type transport system ATP-binding protein